MTAHIALLWGVGFIIDFWFLRSLSFISIHWHWLVSRTPALPVASSCLASGPPGVLRIGICEIGDEVANGIARSGVIVPLSVPTPHSPDPK
ncbi:hypothetical protein U9M48_001409 [Paspalum notatum var. saurae]|uniref:Uncharacterized protein n=1 Tax=Paspalum notatum var. saurae TaxID=547442 RepID=A0AAQ3PNP3_PASNO